MLRKLWMIAVLAVMVVLPMWNQPALAHHSGAAFSNNVIDLKGAVVDYVWRNPHVVVIWDVKGEDGKVVRWTGELASVESRLADGLTKDSLKPGEDVIMTVKPAKSGAPASVIAQIRHADGSMILGYSRRAGGAQANGATKTEGQY